MTTLAIERPYLSVVKLLRALDPKEELVNELTACLGTHVKALRIRWNPTAFRAGLKNAELPNELLCKLEDLLGVAESLHWSLPTTLAEALDQVIEDIESFNPAFVTALNASRASGRVPASLVKKRLGV